MTFESDLSKGVGGLRVVGSSKQLKDDLVLEAIKESNSTSNFRDDDNSSDDEEGISFAISNTRANAGVTLSGRYSSPSNRSRANKSSGVSTATNLSYFLGSCQCF